MNTKTRPSNAERLGLWLGGLWRGSIRRERQVAGWLAAQGVPAIGAAALLWIVKLAVLGSLVRLKNDGECLTLFRPLRGGHHRGGEQRGPRHQFSGINSWLGVASSGSLVHKSALRSIYLFRNCCVIKELERGSKSRFPLQYFAKGGPSGLPFVVPGS